MLVSAVGLGFTGGAISIQTASLSLPVLQGKITLNGLRFDGNSLSVTGGSGSIALPPIKAGGFTVSASAYLSLSTDTAGNLSYDFIGTGTVAVSELGTLNVLLEIGTVEDGHPSNLRRLQLNVEILGAGIPIPETPFEINGMDGALQITGAVGHAVYTFQVGMDLSTDDGGEIYHGNAHATISTDGNFGFGGSGTLFNFIQIAGGFCVRLVVPASDAPDGVCGRTLTQHGARIDASSSTGLYAEVSGSFTIPAPSDCDPDKQECTGIYGDAYMHIWRDDSGPELAATADITAKIPRDAFGGKSVFGLPSCDVSATAGVQIGRFSYGNGQSVRGIKGDIQADVCSFTFDVGIFIDEHGNITTSDVNGYELIDSANNVAYLLTRLPGQAAALQPVHALAAPLKAQQVVVPVRVTPGQKNTVFELGWRSGAPTLSLTAPDGTVYTPNAPGLGNHVFQTTDPHRLSNGFTAGVALFAPNAQPGLWHVTIGGLHGGEGYRFIVNGTPPPPTTQVTAPAAGQTLVASPAATLTGMVQGAGQSNSVSLYYTAAPTTVIKGRTLPNYAGTLISDNAPLHNGTWTYRWDTSSLPAGTYYIYATLNNGTGPAVNAYGQGTVRVVQPARPDAPRRGGRDERRGVDSDVGAAGARGYRRRLPCALSYQRYAARTGVRAQPGQCADVHAQRDAARCGLHGRGVRLRHLQPRERGHGRSRRAQ